MVRISIGFGDSVARIVVFIVIDDAVNVGISVYFSFVDIVNGVDVLVSNG